MIDTSLLLGRLLFCGLRQLSTKCHTNILFIPLILCFKINTEVLMAILIVICLFSYRIFFSTLNYFLYFLVKEKLHVWPFDKSWIFPILDTAWIAVLCRKSMQENEVVNAIHPPNLIPPYIHLSLSTSCQHWTASGTYIVQKHMYANTWPGMNVNNVQLPEIPSFFQEQITSNSIRHNRGVINKSPF